jgi:hypothetical protein
VPPATWHYFFRSSQSEGKSQKSKAKRQNSKNQRGKSQKSKAKNQKNKKLEVRIIGLISKH